MLSLVHVCVLCIHAPFPSRSVAADQPKGALVVHHSRSFTKVPTPKDSRDRKTTILEYWPIGIKIRIFRLGCQYSKIAVPVPIFEY